MGEEKRGIDPQKGRKLRKRTPKYVGEEGKPRPDKIKKHTASGYKKR